MPATWLTADLHFGHEKVASLRGFSTVEGHDDALIMQWQKQVKPDDIVIVLGDLSGGSRAGEFYALSILAKLPGRKRLVSGNHDSISSIHRTRSPHTDLFNSVFERVGDFGRIKVDRNQILLSHYPYSGDHEDIAPRYMEYRLPDRGMPLIHGHTHSETAIRGREMCVSWEAWRRLVDMGDVSAWLKNLNEKDEV